MAHRSDLYSRHTHGPAWQQPAHPIVKTRLTVPERALPCVKLLFAAMKTQGLGYDVAAEASGVLRATLKSWRRRAAPTQATIEACFNAIGWHFAPCPKIEVLPDDIAADLARLAAKMKADIPVVWAAACDMAADQAFLRERAKERIEAREAARDRLRIKRHRGRRVPANDNAKQAETAA